jgi:stalled ribosome rescue protein Dom34
MSKEKSMKRNVGIWIDHRKTVIVSVTDKGEETSLITSDMEKHVRYSGSPQEDSAEDRRDKRFAGHLNKYYDHVISCIRDAESILIFGPGEAKGELEKRLESEALGGRVVSIETVDKMTDRQIAARVRQHFPKRTRKTKKMPKSLSVVL